MKESRVPHHLRSLIWFLGGVFCLVNLPGASLIQTWVPNETPFHDLRSQKTLKDLERIGLKAHLDAAVLNDLLHYQFSTGQPLAETLKDPEWVNRLGLSSRSFKVTWYIANPFDLLPDGLKVAILKHKTSFHSRAEMTRWAKVNKFPNEWRRALSQALIETTPANLYRASRGKKPFAKNGQVLKPIVIDHGQGIYEVRDGHIATDPRIIPTNSDVLLIVRVDGRDRVIKVKAADIGAKIKGHHVDLPIHVGPGLRRMPHTSLPLEIRNPNVRILKPRNFSLNQKA